MSQKNNDDADILFPDATLTVAGEDITVRELTFAQGLKLGGIARPLIDSMADLFAADDEPAYSNLAEVFAEHDGIVMQLLSAATGKDEAWLQQLSDSDGQALLMTLWSVNQDFFIRRLVTRSMEKAQQQRAAATASANSTAH